MKGIKQMIICHVCGFKYSILVKMSTLSNLICRFYAITNKNLALFCEYQQIDYKVYIKGKIPKIVNTILKGTNKIEGLMLLEFKIQYKATVIKIPWFNGADIVISTHRTQKFGHPYYKYVSRYRTYIFYKSYLKMYQQPTYKIKKYIYKNFRRYLGQTQGFIHK